MTDKADDSPEAEAPHVPVLLKEVLAALDPERGGTYVDGTLGAGGYTRAILDAGADRVFALDRDPTAIESAKAWADDYGDRLVLVETRFSSLDTVSDTPLDGVALDLGVSSMQLDQPERGFSFMRDGPLDMRMDRGGVTEGESAADLVNRLEADELADILFRYGEEKQSRRIARAIVEARAEAPIETTARLTEIVASRLPPHRPGQTHPATRSFQALRIAVNAELDELAEALAAAERALAPGGVLAVVSFHSLEDRIVKRFFRDRTGRAPRGSRYEPEVNLSAPSFEKMKHGDVAPSDEEVAVNPRARSARLRAARRTEAQAHPIDAEALGLPRMERRGSRRRR